VALATKIHAAHQATCRKHRASRALSQNRPLDSRIESVKAMLCGLLGLNVHTRGKGSQSDMSEAGVRTCLRRRGASTAKQWVAGRRALGVMRWAQGG
jgi:hypothetical protein